ncbi:M60 family metallopeptidase [Lachnospiraceae bacterium 29-84]
MRRWMAVLLAACLVFQTWTYSDVPVYGAAMDTGEEGAAVREGAAEDASGLQDKEALAEERQADGVQAEEALLEGSQSGEEPGNGALGSKDAKDASEDQEQTESESVLEVEVTTSLFPFQGNVTVKVSGSGSEQVRELVFEGQNTQTASFALDAGTYTVTIQAARFAEYRQTLTLEKDFISKIRVCTTETSIGEGKPCGWMRPGDIDGDGKITQADVQAVLDAIRKDPAGTACDVNGDQKTDIADLQRVVQGLGEPLQESVIEKQMIARIKDVQAAEGTTIVGMDEFLNNTGSVGLIPANTEAEISPANPVGMEFTLAGEDTEVSAIPVIQGMTILAPVEVEPGEDISSAITDGEATVVYVDESGEEQTLPPISLAAASTAAYASGVRAAKADPRAAATVKVEPDGSLVLDFGTQIAVKRVILTITGTKKTEPLVNIAKVEFVNNMEDRIPPPQLNIPTLADLVSGDKALTVSWDAQQNVTGYEIYITGPVKDSSSNQSQIIRVSNTQQIVTSINDKSLVNYGEYTVKVRSVNGEWCSPWSAEKKGIVKPQKKPAKPDNVRAEGGYLSITVTWKDMEDADGYMVYYKKSEGETNFRPVVDGFTQTADGAGRIKAARYVINGLEMNTEYDVYVISWNDLGWGPQSIVSTARVSGDSIQMPKYHLINTSNGVGAKTNHIVNATYGGSGGAHMEGSALDTSGKSAWGLVDNNFASYWVKEDWDDGYSYPANDKGMILTLDDYYKMGYMTFAAMDEKNAPGGARVYYWEKGDASAQGKEIGTRLLRKPDGNGKYYYIVKFDMPVTANKIRLTIGNAGGRLLKIGEIQFHSYDSLEDEVMALYEDEMHTTLRPDVTEQTIKALEDRVNEVDAQSQEKHPLYSELMLEIRTAREILNGNLEPAFVVDNQITAKKDTHLGFGGLNEWQPLGKVAYEGETIIIYVGHNTKRTGVVSDLKLILTQYHAESSAVSGSFTLKVGRNQLTLPKLTTNKTEHGGQLYIAYQGNNSSDKYAVRMQGGSDIPALNLKGKAQAERRQAIQAYVEELEAYVGTIEQKHNDIHLGTNNVNYAYDQTNCILNATDIMLDEMMYSIPATQAWAGIANAADKVTKLDNALKAMDDTMTLFYQHKGLSDNAGTGKGNNARPSRHLNIRYMRMFAGAFMYAAGNHIGIEWGSTTLATGPNDWSGFGWGIAHEIGHNINQGTYAVAEITNNYFAQLLTGTTRYTYQNVYKKVTSGTTGRASNVFTQLAMYWQLHLAFDNNKNDKTIYADYDDQFNNLFFARVDTYSRNPKMAPKAGLALNGGSEQNLMRLACAAANKNILPFFERWGMVPDAATLAYAQKYGEPEEKALYYVNDAARDYRVDHLESEESTTVKGKDAVAKATVTAIPNSSQVRIDIQTNQPKELILGYEVSRSMTSNGEKKTEVVGFIPIDTAASTVYMDTVSAINNRVMEYEVRAVDQFLNYSKAAYAGAAKVQTDGVLDKTKWTVETTLVSEHDVDIEPDPEDPDNGYNESKPGDVAGKKEHTIDRILDNDRSQAGTYVGSITEGAESGTVTIDMHKVERVTALKYQGSDLASLDVEISLDGSTWTKVKKNSVSLSGTAEQTVWFDSLKEDGSIRENWIGTYDARYVRLTLAQAGDISIQEIEICGPSGDNLEFIQTEGGQKAVGVLKEDYKYGNKAEDVIPAGSLVFTGIYKGNPAYNIVILYDTEGNVIGAKDGKVHAEQVIFAEDPKDGNLGETSDGTWVYYVRPGDWDEDSLAGIKGVRGELYRADDAMTLDGERVVSDTQVITLPEELPFITLTGKLPG